MTRADVYRMIDGAHAMDPGVGPASGAIREVAGPRVRRLEGA